MKWLSSTIPSLVLLNLISLGAHLWAINTPPTGVHTWRQCDTAAVARNFYEEGMAIFQPRIDARGAGSGIVGMEFPLVNWLIAGTYHLFGFNHWSGRMVVLFFSLFGNVYFYLIARQFISARAASLATLIFIFGPVYFYYSRNIMPDVPALSLVLGCLYFYLKSEHLQDKRAALWSFLHLCLAGLIKIPYLYMGIVIAGFQLYSERKTFFGADLFRLGKAWLKLSGWLFISALPSVLWWFYAQRLNAITGSEHFLLRLRVTLNPEIILTTLNKVFISGVPEYLLSYPITVFLVVFISVYIYKRREKLNSDFWLLLLCWGGAVSLYLLVHLETLRIHNYYWLPLFPPLAWAAGIGLDYALNHWKALIPRLGLYLLLIAAPLVYGYRFARNLEPSEFDNLESVCDRVIPSGERIITAPDVSSCIMLYYAHRHGWSFTEHATAGEIDQALREGAKYLVSNRSAFGHRAEVRTAFPVILCREGELTILTVAGSLPVSSEAATVMTELPESKQ